MNKQNLMPQMTQPVNRITTGQLSEELAELSEEALSQLGEDALNSSSVQAAGYAATSRKCGCSYDGDDAE